MILFFAYPFLYLDVLKFGPHSNSENNVASYLSDLRWTFDSYCSNRIHDKADSFWQKYASNPAKFESVETIYIAPLWDTLQLITRQLDSLWILSLGTIEPDEAESLFQEAHSLLDTSFLQ